MNRRTVSTITKYLEPKQIFQLITSKSWEYAPTEMKLYYECRDRAFMAASFVSAGRVTAILGGNRYVVKDGVLLKAGKHHGLRLENMGMGEEAITVNDMKVIKRKQKTIEKHGLGITVRDDFLFPLKRNLYESDYGDQLVPFSWLLKEFIDTFMLNAEPDKKLFGFLRGRGWQIIREVTGMFPNWFRAQAEHFYGHYLIPDSVRLSKFVGVVNPHQVAHYIGFSYESLMKDKQRYMDFKWIDPAVEVIKNRING